MAMAAAWRHHMEGGVKSAWRGRNHRAGETAKAVKMAAMAGAASMATSAVIKRNHQQHQARRGGAASIAAGAAMAAWRRNMAWQQYQ